MRLCETYEFNITGRWFAWLFSPRTIDQIQFETFTLLV